MNIIFTISIALHHDMRWYTVTSTDWLVRASVFAPPKIATLRGIRATPVAQVVFSAPGRFEKKNLPAARRRLRLSVHIETLFHRAFYIVLCSCVVLH